MTYASKKVVKELLLNDGTYPGDPQMSSIWKYNSARDHRELILNPFKAPRNG